MIKQIYVKNYKKVGEGKEFMKRRKKRLFAFLLAAAMTASGLPLQGAETAEAAPGTVGENIVLGKEVIASSTANNAGPELTVDGVKDQTQQWNSADMKDWGQAPDTGRDEDAQTPQWIQIDRGADAEPADITSIKLWYNMKV